MQGRNKILIRIVAALLVIVMATTCLLSSIYAKYVTKDKIDATVSFKQWGITITDANNTLVETIEKDGSAVVRANGSITQDGLLAPGTKGSLAWFRVSGNPEVDFSIDFSGTIDFGTGFGLSENLDKVLLLMRIMPDIIEEERVAQSSTHTGLKDLSYPLSAIEEMVVNAVNGVEMSEDTLSVLLKEHRNSNSLHQVDGVFLHPIYEKIKSGYYDGQLVKFKQDLKLRDETGKEIEYLPIIIRCVAYDVITDGEQVTLNKIDPEVLGKDCYCLERVDNLGNVHYFADPAAENISTLESSMNSENEVEKYSLNTVLDTPFNRAGTEIDRIYSVEWEWFYHYATEAEIDAGSVTNNRDSTAVGDYQTADLDTQLGEMIAKYPEFFDINIDISMLVEQVKEPYTRGDTITFGSYPQTMLDPNADAALISTLESKTEGLTWTRYDLGTMDGHLKFADVEYGDDKYRVLKCFDNDTNETLAGTYCFKYEPIEWIVAEEKEGKAFLVSKTLLDMRKYQEGTGVSNNWADSSIRVWLNGTFYDTAFNNLQGRLVLDTVVDDSTEADNIFLLSLDEFTNQYSDKLETVIVKDDSKNYLNIHTDYTNIIYGGAGPTVSNGIKTSLTRSPHNQTGYVTTVGYYRLPGSGANTGWYSSYANVTAIQGVRPALWISLG